MMIIAADKIRCFLLVALVSISSTAAAYRHVREGATQYVDSHRELQQASQRFNIRLINMGTDASFNQAFSRAKQRWEDVITNDLSDVPRNTVTDLFSGYYPGTKTNVDVDDLIIGYRVRSFGRRNRNVIGYAGPRLMREDMSPVSGIMDFNEDVLSTFDSEDVELTVLHEMGHVLGLGTFWPFKCGRGCSEGDMEYTCPKAKAAYEKIMGPNKKLMLENSGGPGTACGHWDEQSFYSFWSSELMTGGFESFKRQPMSNVTLAALEDLGPYDVDYSKGESFSSTFSVSTLLARARSDSNIGKYGHAEFPSIYLLDAQNGTQLLDPRKTYHWQ